MQMRGEKKKKKKKNKGERGPWRPCGSARGRHVLFQPADFLTQNTIISDKLAIYDDEDESTGPSAGL